MKSSSFNTLLGYVVYKFLQVVTFSEFTNSAFKYSFLSQYFCKISHDILYL
jgi:hypothetical protein